MSSFRMRRVSELVKQEISEIIRRDVATGDVGLITVTGCEVASDLKTARVYVSVLGGKEKQAAAMALLERQHGHIQHALGRAVVLKYTPQLHFHMDDSLERGDRVLRILDEIERDNHPDEP
ncbi:MAG: 30S ribosome-binding factor RbfA [Verrucomicrobiae bacterium]|nr:30S ribosome-binding factor RbfA [Verrucomicrobiae bacterium]